MAENKIPIVVTANDKASGVLGKIGGNLKRGIALGAVAAAAGVTALGVASVKMAASFETGFTEVTTLFNASQEQVNALRDDVLEMSRTMGVDAVESTKALYDAISAGVDPQNAVSFLAENAKLAVAGVTDIGTAVDLTTTSLNAFGLEESELGRVTDVMIAGMTAGKTTIGELGAKLFQVAPAAAAAGVSIEDTVASLAALTAAGFPTAQAATSMKQAFFELNKEGTKSAKAFRQIAGVGFKEFMDSGGDVIDVMEIMAKAAEEQGVAVQDLFGSIEAGAAIGFLATVAFEDLVSAQQLALNSAGMTDVAFEKMNKTFDRQMQILKSELKVIMIEFGSKILPHVTNAVRFLIDKLRDLREWWGKNGEEVKRRMREMWNDVKPAIDGIRKLFEVTFPFIANLVKFQLKEIWNAVVLRLQLIVAVFDAFHALFTGNWSELWKQVKTIVMTGLDIIVTEVTRPLRALWSVFNEQFKSISNTVIGWMESMANSVITGMNKLGETLNKGGFLGGIAGFASDLGIPGAEGMQAFFDGAIGEVEFDRLGSDAANAFADGMATAFDQIPQGQDPLTATLPDPGESGGDYGTDFGEAAAEGASGALEDMLDLEEEAAEAARKAAEAFADEWERGLADLRSATEDAFDDISDTIHQMTQEQGERRQAILIAELEILDLQIVAAEERAAIDAQILMRNEQIAQVLAAQAGWQAEIVQLTEQIAEVEAHVAEQVAIIDERLAERVELIKDLRNELVGMENVLTGMESSAMQAARILGRVVAGFAEPAGNSLIAAANELKRAQDAMASLADDARKSLIRDLQGELAGMKAVLTGLESLAIQASKILGRTVAGFQAPEQNPLIIAAKELKAAQEALAGGTGTQAALAAAQARFAAEEALLAGQIATETAHIAAQEALIAERHQKEIRFAHESLAAAEERFAAEEALAVEAMAAQKGRITDQNRLIDEQLALQDEDIALKELIIAQGKLVVEFLQDQIESLEDLVTQGDFVIEFLQRHIDILEATVTPAERAIADLEDYIAALEKIDERQSILNDLLDIELDLYLGLLPTQEEVNKQIADAIVLWADMAEVLGDVEDGSADALDAMFLLSQGFEDIAAQLLAIIAEQDAARFARSGFLPSFDGGGTVPGPLGAPMVAVVHGGEEIGRGGRGGVVVEGGLHVTLPNVRNAQEFMDEVERLLGQRQELAGRGVI